MSTSDRILRKIEKCLALSRSSNEHEAAAALRQAKTLMEKHQLTMTDVEMNKIDVATLGRAATRKPPRWKSDLFGVVARAFGCSLFFRGGQIVLVGKAPGPDVAKYAADVLLRQLALDKKTFLREHVTGNTLLDRAEKIRIGKGYSEGWVCGCRSIVETFAAAITQNERQQHTDRVRLHFAVDRIRAAAPQKSALGGGFGALGGRAGYDAGKEAKIHAGMNSDGEPERLVPLGAGLGGG